jgi:asparagine synthase (glutamine-hydrolysing)
MCGIAGYAGPAPLGPERIHATLPLMRHRGPDDQSVRSFETPAGRHVSLLHARLAIIDLAERSNQPFRVGDRWMAYNGELYNYLEVRRALGDERFATDSDTEVMLHQLVRHGWEGLDACEGMWAFASYDQSTGEIALCRDRFGEKPLYLYREGDALYFGSEIKFIAAMLGRPLRPNLRHLQRYLVNGYKSLYKSPETFFEGVSELPAGAVLRRAGDGSEQTRRYWTPSRPEADEDMSWEEAVAGTRERLIRSVELRLRADVPLAFCMSGGVDSIALISIARRELGHDVHGFTIVNTDERYEEADMVERGVAELDLRHTSIPVETHDFLPRLRGLVRQHDAPLYTITYYAHWLLMQAIHERGYRISISGTAADELFSGYYDHHLFYLAAVHGNPAVHGPALAAWRDHVEPVVRNPFLKDPDRFIGDPDERGHIYLDADEFRAGLREPFGEGFTELDLADVPLRNRMLNELFAESVPVILHEDDLNAMAFSIENRSPFLDRSLFDFSQSIPTRHLVRDGRAKAVLREAMRGIAPDAIMDNRRKVGFNAPVLDFLDTSDRAVRDEILDPSSPVWEVVRRDAVERIMALDHLPNSRSKFLFNVVCAKLFLEEFT